MHSYFEICVRGHISLFIYAFSIYGALSYQVCFLNIQKLSEEYAFLWKRQEMSNYNRNAECFDKLNKTMKKYFLS